MALKPNWVISNFYIKWIVVAEMSIIFFLPYDKNNQHLWPLLEEIFWILFVYMRTQQSAVQKL